METGRRISRRHRWNLGPDAVWQQWIFNCVIMFDDSIEYASANRRAWASARAYIQQLRSELFRTTVGGLKLGGLKQKLPCPQRIDRTTWVFLLAAWIGRHRFNLRIARSVFSFRRRFRLHVSVTPYVWHHSHCTNILCRDGRFERCNLCIRLLSKSTKSLIAGQRPFYGTFTSVLLKPRTASSHKSSAQLMLLLLDAARRLSMACLTASILELNVRCQPYVGRKKLRSLPCRQT
jgi:hypothetical protein